MGQVNDSDVYPVTVPTFDDRFLLIDATTPESLRLGTLTALKTLLGQGMAFETRTAAVSATIDSTVNLIQTGGYTTFGDGGGARYKRVGSSPSHALKFQSADDAWWEIVPDQGVLHIRQAGAKGDNATDDTTAIQDAADFAVPVYFDAGTYLITGNISLSNGTEFIGPHKGDAIIEVTAIDIRHFSADGIAYFRFSGIRLDGDIDSTGTTTAANRAAIVIKDVPDFDIEFCHFEQHAGSGITINREGTSVSSGRIRFNRFVKGNMTNAVNVWGTDNNSPVQVFKFSQGIIIEGNHATGNWSTGILIQDLVDDGATRIHDLVVINNRLIGMSKYGIICYTSFTLTITGIADNGSGLFRVTAASHNMTTGDRVHMGACGTASGIWTVTVITSSTFDLDDSVFVSGSANGDLRMSENCSGYFAGNHIEDIKGEEDTGGSVFPYGAGFYVQSAGGITAVGNTFLRTNKQSTSETLTPGSIGINGATGPVNFDGGYIRDSGYSGIFLSGGTNFFGAISFGPGMDIAGSAKRDFRSKVTRNLSVGALLVRPREERGTMGGVFISDAEDLSIDGLRMPQTNGLNRLMHIKDCTRFSVRGVKLQNKAPNHGAASELAYFEGGTDGIIQGCDFDNGLSEYQALTIDACTDTIVSGCRSRMTPGSPARPTVKLLNTCTDTIYMLDNIHHFGRMENISTGGFMLTFAPDNDSGGKTRQQGDVILHTNPTTGTQGFWHKITASTSTTNWEAAAIS